MSSRATATARLVGYRQLAGVANWTTEHARNGEFHHFDWAHGPLHSFRQSAYLAWLQRRGMKDMMLVVLFEAEDRTELRVRLH